MFKKNLIFSFFVIFLLILLTNLTAKDNFSATIYLKETNEIGKTVYEDKQKVVLEKNNINKNIRYKEILELILLRIKKFEKKFKSEEVLFLDTIIDKSKNKWTITITVKDKETSISHFISKQKI